MKKTKPWQRERFVLDIPNGLLDVEFRLQTKRGRIQQRNVTLRTAQQQMSEYVVARRSNHAIWLVAEDEKSMTGISNRGNKKPAV